MLGDAASVLDSASLDDTAMNPAVESFWGWLADVRAEEGAPRGRPAPNARRQNTRKFAPRPSFGS